jgi:hypothetical protein
MAATSDLSMIDYYLHSSHYFVPDRWVFMQLCLTLIVLTIVLLIIVMIYQCLVSIRHRQRKSTITTCPSSLPTVAPLLIEHHRSPTNRLSTISSCTSNDTKSRSTDVSVVFNTPLNIYPTTPNRHSTSTTSSYYMFPNDFEQLCK